MASTTSVWIPCETFLVTVTADASEPTEFEKAVMLFLAWRDSHSLEDVVAFLGLSERITLDLLIGLWKQGYLLVDTIDGGVRLDPDWKKVVLEGRWAAIPTGTRTTETVALMRELASGQIIPDRGSRLAPPPEFAVPILVDSSVAEAISPTTLATAAVRNLRQGSPLRRDIRKVRAEIRREGGGSGLRAIGWLRLDLDAEVDDAGETLTLRPGHVEDAELTRAAPKIARSLTEWSLENGDHPLVRHFLASGTRRPLQPTQSLRAKLEALTEQIELAAQSGAPSVGQIEELTRELEIVSSEIEALQTASANPRLVELGAKGTDFLQQAADFKHQLVLSTPDLDLTGLERCADILVPRLKALPVDASAVLLWGGQQGNTLPGAASRYLENLASEARGPERSKLHVSTRPSRVSTALAIRDGTTVLYASSPSLAAATTDPPRFDFMIAIEAGPASPLPRQLLELARSRAPDPGLAELIEMAPWPARSREPPPTVLPLTASSPEMEMDDPLEGGTLFQLAAMRDLLTTARMAGARLDLAGPTVEALADADLFQRALEMVNDDAGSGDSMWIGFGREHRSGGTIHLHRKLVEAIEARVAHGLPTVLLLDQTDARGAVDRTALRHLCENASPSLRVIDAPGLPGHFVCGERRLLVSPGGLASAPQVRAGTISRLVGIAAADQELCGSFRKMLGRNWPALRALEAAIGSQRQAKGPTFTGTSSQLLPLLRAWRARPTEGRAALAGALSQPDGGRLGKEFLEIANASQDAEAADLRRDILAALATAGPRDLKKRALGELALSAWRDGAWQEAALLLEGGATDACDIPADFAAAVARVTVGLPLAELPRAFESLEPDSWTAVVVLGLLAVLFNGDGDAAEQLEIKLALNPAPPVAGPVPRLAEAVLAHWAATGQQVDRESIRSLRDRRDAQESVKTQALAFRDTFQLGVNANLNNSMLKRVVPRFYAETSGLRPIFEMITDDGSAVSWPRVLAELSKIFSDTRVDPGQLAEEILDRTHRDFAKPNDERILGGKGARIRTLAREAMERALALRDTLRVALNADETAPGPDLSRLLERVEEEMPALDALGRDWRAGELARPLLRGLASQLVRLGAPA